MCILFLYQVAPAAVSDGLDGPATEPVAVTVTEITTSGLLAIVSTHLLRMKMSLLLETALYLVCRGVHS